MEERPAVDGSGKGFFGRASAVFTGGRAFVGEAVSHRIALDLGVARRPVPVTIFSTKMGGIPDPSLDSFDEPSVFVALPAFREAPEGVLAVREQVNRTIGEIQVRVHDIPEALEGCADSEKLPYVVRALTQGDADAFVVPPPALRIGNESASSRRAGIAERRPVSEDGDVRDSIDILENLLDVGLGSSGLRFSTFAGTAKTFSGGGFARWCMRALEVILLIDRYRS